jgi:hypothetical protein
MAVRVFVKLFDRPADELGGRGRGVTSADVRELGEYLDGHLLNVAIVLRRLEEAGWKARLGKYHLVLTHPDVTTRAAAEERLKPVAALDVVEFRIRE